MKTGVLASGSGTNLQALIDAWRDRSLAPAELVVVGSNNAGCLALERAQKVGIETFVLSHKAFATREDFDRALVTELRSRSVELVVLAGFMRVLKPGFLTAFTRKIVNLHPSLLPSFPGLDGVGQAWRRGVKVTGCTVHYVTPDVDGGPIIDQTAVRIGPDDTLESLADRIHTAEHVLLPEVIARLSLAGEIG